MHFQPSQERQGNENYGFLLAIRLALPLLPSFLFLPSNSDQQVRKEEEEEEEREEEQEEEIWCQRLSNQLNPRFSSSRVLSSLFGRRKSQLLLLLIY